MEKPREPLFTRGSRYGFPVLLLLLAVLAIYVGVAVGSANTRQHRQQVELAQQQKALARSARAIQRERYEVTYRNCRDQNRRHDNVFAYLDKLARTEERQGQPKATVERGLFEFKTLMSAALPKADCVKKARLAVRRH